MDDLDRRQLLQRGGLGVATAMSVLSAGCLDGIPGFQEETSTPTTQERSTDTRTTPPGTQSRSLDTRTPPTTTQSQPSATETPPPTAQDQLSVDEGRSYTTWLYAPHRFSLGDHYPFNVVKPQSLQQHRFQLSGYLNTLLSSIIEGGRDLNYSFESIEMQITFTGSNSYVTLGRFDISEMEVGLRQSGFTRESEYRDFTLFRRDAGGRPPGTIAVNNTALISDYKHNSISTKRVVKTIIDTKTGRANSYIEQNKALAMLSEQLNGGDVIWTGASPANGTTFSDLSAFRTVPIDIGGVSIQLGNQNSLLTLALVFDTDHTVDSRDKTVAKEYIRSNYLGGLASNISFSQKNHMVIAKAVLPTTDLVKVVSRGR